VGGTAENWKELELAVSVELELAVWQNWKELRNC